MRQRFGETIANGASLFPCIPREPGFVNAGCRGILFTSCGDNSPAERKPEKKAPPFRRRKTNFGGGTAVLKKNSRSKALFQ
jgi:hypothetical protein